MKRERIISNLLTDLSKHQPYQKNNLIILENFEYPIEIWINLPQIFFKAKTLTVALNYYVPEESLISWQNKVEQFRKLNKNPDIWFKANVIEHRIFFFLKRPDILAIEKTIVMLTSIAKEMGLTAASYVKCAAIGEKLDNIYNM